MTRKKRARTVGSEGPAVYREKSNSKVDIETRERQKAKKRKGLKSGSRHSAVEDNKQRNGGQKKDPRLGSKKLVPLIVEPKKPQTKQQRRLSAEQELAMLENDAQLMVLLDRIDAGEKLGAGLQKQVDMKLDRIERLMKQLGLFDDVEEASAPVTASTKSKPRSDDDLLAQFENMDFDNFDKE
ncbi:Der GTPase-activating protein YihI [Photobacterium aquimaris]|uniref:Der GTPase-activating protein YihI n=1 Tax=Photobacterium aquimaris TaxID=512643 RepID=A0A1B8I3L1_9GAMM|nr:Der GTPase-activating protein YihI [Photobacterium aquimaris]MCP4956312.1 GTPase-activating protein [Photobacterium aquimaris]OBU24776.1 GTPase-activating protein [Photobacterium aquimaris]PQJ36721.1 GTPase-activating protein [Photobacterium aquimaris]PSU05272.1 GTPase-activating protein [Photobacterium aquimaris]SMY17954.1 Der GTPase-activating protein YihI [Photobacterium aquimaris]